MTAAEKLADLALATPDRAQTQKIRALVLANVSAGLGALGRAGQLIDALGFEPARPADVAALNAMVLHARTQDDFYPAGRVHVGAVTLAATLALAGPARTRFVECLAAGYEVMCAVAAVYSAEAQQRGYRPTGVFGPLGAAASAAVALGLGPVGVANAIGLATTMSAGTNQCWITGTDEWLTEVGAAARGGVEAALFTQAGVLAAPDAIEGTAGWAHAFFADTGAARLLASLERSSSRVGDVAIKPYPVSGIAQVPTQLACQAHRKVGGRNPSQILVRMSEAEANYPGTMNRGPFRSRSDALMSVAFCVASALSDGTIRMERLERANEGESARLVSRVSVEPDASIAETEAVLEVALDDELVRLSGDGRALLYPTWGELAGQPERLAERSEAKPTSIHALIHELKRSSVNPGTIAALLRGEISGVGHQSLRRSYGTPTERFQ